jgi:predicted kinase|tara:strand:+ start:10770 stop:11510 length:741 start_codon:yes stop_codon:yes gene_type:complete
MIKLMDLLNEGVQDKGIFKAVFLAGGPGSGKTYAAKQIFGIPDKFNISMSGMKMVNSDKELKFLLKKFHFGTDLDKMPDEVFKNLTDDSLPDSSGLRKFGKSLTKERMRLYRQGKLGMIIDGTGHDFGKIQTMKSELEADGYDTYMVMVNTSLEVAQQRNQERDRILPPKLLKKSWEDVQQNLGSFQSLFKNNFVIVDNSKHLSDEEAEAKFVPLVTKVVRKFVGQPIKNKLGKLWVGKQKLLRRK